jgi:hypothetical protein
VRNPARIAVQRERGPQRCSMTIRRATAGTQKACEIWTRCTAKTVRLIIRNDEHAGSITGWGFSF